MDPDTITTITSGGNSQTCSGTFQASFGTFQVSKDNFTNCLKMNAPPVASDGNKTFTVTPSSTLDKGQEYKVRIISGNSGAKDKFGNNLSSNIGITFTTSSS